jgi:hypothetical protein
MALVLWYTNLNSVEYYLIRWFLILYQGILGVISIILFELTDWQIGVYVSSIAPIYLYIIFENLITYKYYTKIILHGIFWVIFRSVVLGLVLILLGIWIPIQDMYILLMLWMIILFTIFIENIVSCPADRCCREPYEEF